MYIDRQVGRWVGRCLGLYIRYPQSHWLITVVQMKIANFIHKKIGVQLPKFQTNLYQVVDYTMYIPGYIHMFGEHPHPNIAKFRQKSPPRGAGCLPWPWLSCEDGRNTLNIWGHMGFEWLAIEKMLCNRWSINICRRYFPASRSSEF